MLEKFDVENNLIVSLIPDALIAAPNLEVINLSRNNLAGVIPHTIGLLTNMREIKFDQNSLTGSIPREMFNLQNIERLEVQANALTGLIHTHIGKLQSATFISLSHNALKGRIPSEIAKLRNLQFLHLHANLLTGRAPHMPWLRELGAVFGDHERYITDCGMPWYSLANPLDCPSCTLCCNSDEMCQENRVWPIPIEQGAFIVTFGTTIAFSVLCLLMFLLFKFLNQKMVEALDTRDTEDFLDEASTYCFIFCNNIFAWVIYWIVYLLQGGFYYMFLLASSFTTISSDWQFTFRCPSTTTECKDSSTVNTFGWIMFFVVMLLTLSVDYINSALQIRKAVAILDLRLFVSGFLFLSISVLAMFCSFYYNLALATTNTELIVNAVILLFINDLDEQLMDALGALVPDWVDERVEEAKNNLRLKQTQTEKQNQDQHQAQNQTVSVSPVWLKNHKNHKNQNEFDNININNNNNNVAVETSLPTSLSEPEPSPEPSPESYKENAHVASRDGEQMQMLDEASEEPDVGSWLDEVFKENAEDTFSDSKEDRNFIY